MPHSSHLWCHSLKRAERESKNKDWPSVNRLASSFLPSRRALCRFIVLYIVVSRTELSFLFSAIFPGLFTVPLMRMTDLLSRPGVVNR